MELIERQAALESLVGAFARVLGGTGQVALVGAEAGGGKSAVVTAFLERLPTGVRVRRGWCDALSTPRPLGPFLDMAPTALRERISAAPSRTEILAAVQEMLASASPQVILVEDIHWADEATLDCLRFLARRIEGVRSLLILTYRDDEVGVGDEVQILLGELATNHAVRRIELAPLSRAGIADLLEGSGLDAGEVLTVTAGNPFYVTELRDAGGDAVPRRARDAVLARAGRLTPHARAVLEAAAVVGLRAEQAIVEEIAGVPSIALDDCVRAGLVASNLGQLVFRHEIARQAIEEAIPPARRRELHGRALAALRRHPLTVAVTRLVRHAEEVGDGPALRGYAAAAGDEAAAAGAHREAAAQYDRALRAGTADDTERASLSRRRSYECYVTGEIDLALEAMEHAIELHRQQDDLQQVGSGLRWVARLEWFLAHRARGARAIAESIAILERAGDPIELAWAYSSRSQLAMLEHDTTLAIDLGRRALEVAGADALPELRAHALNNIGTARLMDGDPAGAGDLRVALALALAHELEEHAARVYCNLVAVDLQQHRLGAVGAWLDEGLEYCRERDLDAWYGYLLGWRSRLELDRGDLAAAEATASATIAHPRFSPVARVTPLVVLALVRARRGDAAATPELEEAQAIARGSGEIQRLAPAAVAAAEIAWLCGSEPPLEQLRDALALARSRREPWAAGELASWLQRLGAPVEPPPGLPAPYAASLAGAHAESARLWRAAQAPFAEAQALVDLADAASLGRAVRLLDGLGATGAAAVPRRLLRELGGTVPAGPRRATRANPAGLTRRELEVLALLRSGSTDAEIAERLVISVRTAGHHVSAILRKLGVSTRARAASRAGELLEPRQAEHQR